MFDYRSFAVDEHRRLFPFSVREADWAERVPPQKQQQQMDNEHAKTPYGGRRCSGVRLPCVEPQAGPGHGVAGLEHAAHPAVGGRFCRRQPRHLDPAQLLPGPRLQGRRCEDRCAGMGSGVHPQPGIGIHPRAGGLWPGCARADGGQARLFAGPQRHRVVAGVGQRQACRR